MKELLSDIEWGETPRSVVKFADLIEPTELDNTNENQEHGDKSFKTKDLVYVESKPEIENDSYDDRVVYPTDYAVMCGAMLSDSFYGPKSRKSTWSWLRSADSDYYVKNVYLDGGLQL